MEVPLPGVSLKPSYNGTQDQGSTFPIRDPSNYFVVDVIWTFVGRVTYMYPVIGVRWCKAWDIHPVFKNLFFLFSDSRFVIRAIYLPSLFQPLPRWWPLTPGITSKIWQENYILSVNVVGFIYVTYLTSMNPVMVALSWKAQAGIFEHPVGGGLHGGATPAGCSCPVFHFNRFPLDPPACDDFPKLAHPS